MEWQKLRGSRATTLTRDDEVILNSDRRISIDKSSSGDTDTFSMTITDVETRDEGTYRCETTATIPINKDVDLTILGMRYYKILITPPS